MVMLAPALGVAARILQPLVDGGRRILGGRARRLGEPFRLSVVKLQRDRMFAGVEGEQPLARAERHRVG
jgi:hypothetical protein